MGSEPHSPHFISWCGDTGWGLARLACMAPGAVDLLSRAAACLKSEPACDNPFPVSGQFEGSGMMQCTFFNSTQKAYYLLSRGQGLEEASLKRKVSRSEA